MLWATKQSFPGTDQCTCEFMTDPADGPKVHDETCARTHDETCRLSYRPDTTLPKHLPFGWGKHRSGCCCKTWDCEHKCTCTCSPIPTPKP